MLYQRTDRINLIAQLIESRTEYCTLNLYHILITVENTVNRYDITIVYLKSSHLKLPYVIDRLLSAGLTQQTDTLLIGIACKATCILQQGGDTLRLKHLVKHRTLDITLYLYQGIVRTHDYHVIILQTNIARHLAIKNIVIDIHCGNLSATTENLDASQRSEVTDTACHIQGMEHSRESTQRIGTRNFDLTHHIHHDRTSLTHGHIDTGTTIARAQSSTEFFFGCCHT